MKVYRFERVELDLARYEVRRNGRRLHLARVPMELLILLVERRGTLITREEIIRHLWSEPDSIDVVQGLNSAVKRVRDVLNDDPARPRFIETVVGKGYRFITTVEEQLAVEAAVEKPSPVQLAENTAPPPAMPERALPDVSPNQMGTARKTRWRRQMAWSGGIAVVLLLLAGIGLFYFKSQPAFEDTSPGMLQLTMNQGDDPVRAVAISSDGRSLAYADAEGLYLRTASGNTRPLPAPEHFSSTGVSWFPDDSRLLLSGVGDASRKAQMWIISVNGAPPFLVREDAKNGVPSPDGRRIAFTNAAETEVLVANSDGRDETRVLSSYGHDTFPLILWSSDGKLRYERRHFEVSDTSSNRFGPEFEENYLWSGEVLDLNSRQIVASTPDFRMDSACPARNGRMLFSVKQRVGGYYLKEVDVDPKTNQLVMPPRIVRNLDTSYAASLSCSSDNKTAVAVLWRGQPDTYTAEVNALDNRLTDVRRLTFSSKQDYPHAWTPDSRAVIFESDRLGSFAIFKQAIDQKTPELIVHTAAQSVLAQVTPDGRWILYDSIGGKAAAGAWTLMRVPLNGGRPEPVPIGGALDEFRCPLAGKNGCVLRETRADQDFIYYALDPVRGKGEELARRKWAPSVLGDWDVSPDGHVLAIPSHDPADTRILLLPLKCAGSSLKPREIVLKNVGTLWSTVWSANGRGLYVAARDQPEASLLYVPEAGGPTRVLLKTRGLTWAVPSPDSKRLAFWQATPDQNIWRVR